MGRTMGVRCRDCGRESRLEPQCLERPSTPLIQLLFSCKSYQHFLLTPTITPHSWALFSLFTAHQGEGAREDRGKSQRRGRKSETDWLLILTDRMARPPSSPPSLRSSLAGFLPQRSPLVFAVGFPCQATVVGADATSCRPPTAASATARALF